MFLQPRRVPMILKDDCPMKPSCHFFWELKVSHVKYRYSSDGWFGVGTEDVSQLDAKNLIQNSSSKENFWGYGSNGTITHNNVIKLYGPHFHEGDTLGAHLDLFRGTLEFHRNRKPLGIAFTGIPNNVTLYPVLIGSTAIPTPGEIDGPHSFSPTLQILSYQILARHTPYDTILQNLPPGLCKLAQSFKFLHYCTGESPNPGIYSNNFVMVIDSDSEEENSFIAKPARTRKRNKFHETVSARSNSPNNWTGFTERDSLIIRNKKSTDEEPSCSSWGNTQNRNNLRLSASVKSMNVPKKRQPRGRPPKNRQPLNDKVSISAPKGRPRGRSPKNSEPLDDSDIIFSPNSSRSHAASNGGLRKSKRLVKKGGCCCNDNC